jgi:bacteriophage HK97-gp10 putative tail-component
MKLIVQMRGLDALSLKVQYLKKAARTGLKLSVSEAADLFVQGAKALVPVDTGRLQEAIHAEPLDNKEERQVLQVAPFVEAPNEYGFDPAYARRIEYGFIGQDKLGRTYHQAAQPYMRPAFDAHQAEAAETIKEGVYASLDDAMNQVAARRR